MRSALILAAVGAVAAGLARGVLLVVRVDGDSMSPTFRAGDAVLAIRRRSRPVRRGAVVIFRLPPEIPGPSGFLVKRAVAVSGDPQPDRREQTVPAGQVFLQGDGAASYDSRAFGPLELRHVHGTILGRRPLSRRRSEHR